MAVVVAFQTTGCVDMGIQCWLTNSIQAFTGALLRTAGLVALASLPAGAAQLCSPADIHGPYGLQLDGVTTIAGSEIPIAVVGRLTLDSDGTVSGVTSVNFNGLFLGNPTTGKFDIQTDCTLTLSLQDTSGAFQHFAGTSEPGGGRVEMRQTDPKTHERGWLVRSPDHCDAAAFHGQFDFSLSGHSTPLVSEGVKGAGSAKAVVQADGSGSLVVQRGDAKTGGTYTVDADCFVQLEFGLSDGDNSALVKLRGVLVNDGKELLAVETDPEQVAAARFSQ